MTPRVWNFYFDEDMPPDAVCIMRRGKWGNKFSRADGYTHDQCVSLHRQMVFADAELRKEIRRELRGKDLYCRCKPDTCHGDVLLWVANWDPAI